MAKKKDSSVKGLVIKSPKLAKNTTKVNAVKTPKGAEVKIKKFLA